MRVSNRGPHVSVTVAGLAFVLVITACGGSTTTPPPNGSVAPVVTPDPHLREPVSVDALYRLVAKAGIRITPNTASTGAKGEPVKRIVGTYDDWPIVISQYTTGLALRREAKFDPKVPPTRGEAPYIVQGLNILIEYGPRITNERTPPPPPDDKQAAMLALVTVLDPLLGPLAQRSVVPLPLATPAASPSPSASRSPVPSKKPKPSPKVTPKPSRKT